EIDWAREQLLLSGDVLHGAEEALRSEKSLTAVPDMTLLGKFGTNAVVAYRPADAAPGSPGLLILVDQAGILASLTPLIWSISAAIGGLCLASTVFAGILLWLRFYDQVRTNKNIQFLAHHDA
ncbi:MAG: GGDEF-domain containing protein, partial [Roseibium sp.]|nr:GGDEF-domain containing protein [Roseibium sp.]